MSRKSIVLDPEATLRDHGFKITPLRIALVETLATSTKPLTIATINKKVKRLHADPVTVYRAIDAFVEKHLVRKLTLIEGVHSYDLMYEGEHGHHIVCTNCNAIESIPFCVRSLESNAKEKSRLFKIISGHNLSFNGTCRKCARAVR